MAGINKILGALLLVVCLPLAASDLEGLVREAGMEAYPVALKAPVFRLPDLDGRLRGNGDYQGRVVLLNFWASWCPPCREEFPSLQRLQAALGGGDFTVLAVAVADAEAAVMTFLSGRRPAFDVLLDGDRDTATAFHAAGVPVTYLLDQRGRLLAGRTGAQHWDSPAMQRLIREAVLAGR